MSLKLLINGSPYLAPALTGSLVLDRDWLCSRAKVKDSHKVVIYYMAWGADAPVRLDADEKLTTDIPLSVWVTELL